MTDFDFDQTDRLMMTTKQVRKRLDLSRAVPHNTVLECIDVASRAPIGGNIQVNRWLLADDPDIKQGLAECYRAKGTDYLNAGVEQVTAGVADPIQTRVVESSVYLLKHLHEVPMMIIPIRMGRPDNTIFGQATFWGPVTPGVWSLQMALRSRGIGTAWTTLHLYEEQRARELLGLPDTVTQIALLPAAFYTGDRFSPSKRRPAHEITYLNGWQKPVS